MRTNIEIDHDVPTAVMQATGQTTKTATIEMALRHVLISHHPHIIFLAIQQQYKV
jgi:Arc/MetJ family transcription regulator